MSDVESWLTPDQKLRLECARIAGDDGTGRSVSNAPSPQALSVAKLIRSADGRPAFIRSMVFDPELKRPVLHLSTLPRQPSRLIGVARAGSIA